MASAADLALIDNPVPWPDGARCAVAITFDVDTDSFLHLDYPDRAPDLLASMSWLKYDEVAIPRILALFRHFGIRQTFFYPAWCMERYPHLVDMILRDGHEIAAHGYLHEAANSMSRERQVYWLDRQVETIRRMTGQIPAGWRGPLYSISRDTPELLVERGFRYDATLMGDDVPYYLETRRGPLTILPSHWAMDDWPQFTHAPEFNYMMPIRSPDEGFAVFDAEFEAQWNHGGLLVTVWHPFVTGRLARLQRLAHWIEALQKRGGVWFATLEQIADHVDRVSREGLWMPRRHTYPYYEGRIAEYQAETRTDRAA